MSSGNLPTDPDAETLGLPDDEGDSGEGSMPEPATVASQGMPSEIGRYKILAVIASGGMGTVYEAMQESPRRRVALKVIKVGAANEMALRRFEFESQVLAKLRHPNIAQIYEAGTWESEQGTAPFFAMEYIPDRRPIIEFADKKDLTIRERMDLFVKICNAVHHGHQKGIIHRDLKPDNILCDGSGEPKIIDFGVARATDADMAVTTMQTTMGQLIGTLQYMSPEQCEANPDAIDIRSDVYALGVIFFQLLSGQLPYDLRRQAIHEAVRVIQEVRPDSMSTTNIRLRGDIEVIAMKALEKDRQRRYQSASDLAQDIHHFLNNEPIEARPLSIAYQARLFSKKYKRTVAAAALIALSIIIGGTASVLGWREADRQRGLVQSRNQVLEGTVVSLLTGVRDVVQDLGDSAEAQRALLDLANENLSALDDGTPTTPRERSQLAAIWLRNAKSNLSVSGIGFGGVDDAESSLNRADAALDSIDLETVADEKLAMGIQNMRLDLPKYLAEAARVRAELATSEASKQTLLQQATAVYRDRSASGRAYFDSTGHWKGLDVQWSSQQGLGNTLLGLNDEDGARAAFGNALDHAGKLIDLQPAKSVRWRRGKAIALYSLARLDAAEDPSAALSSLNQSVPIARIIMEDEAHNDRRPRDLALMLALRGEIRVKNDLDAQAGLEDLRESATLLTLRAVESPRELASQQDFAETLTTINEVLLKASYDDVAQRIRGDAISQLQCIADAEALAGRDAWQGILQDLSGEPQPATAAVP